MRLHLRADDLQTFPRSGLIRLPFSRSLPLAHTTTWFSITFCCVVAWRAFCRLFLFVDFYGPRAQQGASSARIDGGICEMNGPRATVFGCAGPWKNAAGRGPTSSRCNFLISCSYSAPCKGLLGESHKLPRASSHSHRFYLYMASIALFTAEVAASCPLWSLSLSILHRHDHSSVEQDCQLSTVVERHFC